MNSHQFTENKLYAALKGYSAFLIRKIVLKQNWNTIFTFQFVKDQKHC